MESFSDLINWKNEYHASQNSLKEEKIKQLKAECLARQVAEGEPIINRFYEKFPELKMLDFQINVIINEITFEDNNLDKPIIDHETLVISNIEGVRVRLWFDSCYNLSAQKLPTEEHDKFDYAVAGTVNREQHLCEIIAMIERAKSLSPKQTISEIPIGEPRLWLYEDSEEYKILIDIVARKIASTRGWKVEIEDNLLDRTDNPRVNEHVALAIASIEGVNQYLVNYGPKPTANPPSKPPNSGAILY